MSASSLHYESGAEVHAGDRVNYNGELGHIAFVSTGDGGEFLVGFMDHQGCDEGIMFCSDAGELTFLSEGHENLEFLRRKDQAAGFAG
jgi:hypothetical protein